MNEEVLLAISTFPDSDTARQIVRQLVSENLVACGTIIPIVESIYRWKENIENSNEALVLFKTAAARSSEFQLRLKALHPYDVPEILCFDVSSGLQDYLSWVANSTVAD